MDTISHITKRWYYGITGAFILIASVGIVAGWWPLLLIPCVLAIALLGVFRLDVLFMLCAALVPLSINLSETDFGFGFSMPSEPIIFGMMLLVVVKLLMNSNIDRKYMQHPVSIVLICYLSWMFFTALTSHMPLVSLKYWLARFTFIFVFFYFASELFRVVNKIATFILIHGLAFLVIIIYTTSVHASRLFTEEAAHSAMTPFYNDHTAYAMVVALLIPVTFIMMIGKGYSLAYRQYSIVIFLFLVLALVLSYTRAAWVGVAAAIACSFVIIFKISRTFIAIAMVMCSLFLLININNIILGLENNQEQSSTDLGAHVQSITNIKTDPSNVERINRWSCAWRMFLQRPVVGWGPGTYQFVYGPFQLQKEKTVISTLAGNRGNAHSEFLGPLCEQGVPGTLLFMAMVIVTLITASRVFRHGHTPQVRWLAVGLILGLITYWVHGLLNNFLDTEKAAVPYFAFIAALTALDVYHTQRSSHHPIKLIN